MKKFGLGLLVSLLMGPVSADTLVLTGEIQSAQSQVVTAPKGDRWQIMLQWMAEEGEVVEAGDLVAVFDSGGIQTQLEQNQQTLEMQKLEMEKLEMDLTQAVTEAEGQLKLANYSVEKARIEASIEDGEISAFDKGRYQVAYEKALMDKIKAEENLALKLKERQVGIEKQRISMMRIEENIAYQSSQLEKMSVRAQVTGPVMPAAHPWNNGRMITAGSNVQASWKILTVQGKSGYQIKTWIHEIDAARVNPDEGELTVILDAYPQHRLVGRLIKQNSQAESRGHWSDSAYYELVVGFEPPDDIALSPGMSARVELQFGQQEESRND